MLPKAFQIIISTVAFLILISCKNEKRDNFYGYYQIDKFVVKNKENNIPDFRILKINENNTFELLKEKNDLTNIIEGKFKLSSQNSQEKTFVFFHNGKEITGILRGNIFYFIYPNHFHDDKYQSVLYVKLNN